MCIFGTLKNAEPSTSTIVDSGHFTNYKVKHIFMNFTVNFCLEHESITSISNFRFEARGLIFCIQTLHIHAQARVRWQMKQALACKAAEPRKTIISQVLGKISNIRFVTFLH